MKKAKVFFNVSPECLKDKNYYPRFLPALKQCSKYSANNDGTGTFIIDKKAFVKKLRHEYDLSTYFANRIYEVYLEHDIVTEDNTIVTPKQYFIVLPLDFAEVLSHELDDFQFRVYLFLLRSYNYYKTKTYPCNLSRMNILLSCGYSAANKNYIKVNEALRLMKSYNLIDYKEKKIYNKTLILLKVRSESGELDSGEEKCSAI